jgi:hypothetical protein
MKLAYRYPNLHTPNAQQLPDPEEVNACFEDVARIVNGGLDLDNLAPSARPALSMFACPRSAGVVAFALRADGSDGAFEVMVPPVPVRLDAIGVNAVPLGEVTSGVEILVDGSPVASADDSLGSAAFIRQVGVEVAADSIVSVEVTNGTVLGVSLFISAEHLS